jgi:hypothetical protein
MYHGTRATSPNIIYQSEEGFDMTYSNQGMWGHANYFAKNASYSHGYRYSMPGTGTSQMFVANVLVGKTAVLSPDNSLRRPPLITGSNLAYDSV